MSSAPKLTPQVVSDEVRALLTEAQKRALSAGHAVATEAWWRTYWRANPHKWAAFVAENIPKQVTGAGEGGEHVLRIVHSIPRSALDDMHVIDGKAIEVPPVPLREDADAGTS